MKAVGGVSLVVAEAINRSCGKSDQRSNVWDAKEYRASQPELTVIWLSGLAKGEVPFGLIHGAKGKRRKRLCEEFVGSVMPLEFLVYTRESIGMTRLLSDERNARSCDSHLQVALNVSTQGPSSSVT